jgi:hypothetical protein
MNFFGVERQWRDYIPAPFNNRTNLRGAGNASTVIVKGKPLPLPGIELQPFSP